MSMMRTLYVLRYAKGNCWVEVTSNSEKIMPITLVVSSYACPETLG